MEVAILTAHQVEAHLRQVEQMALVPYTLSAGWYGIGVEFKRCPKRNGGNIKRGSAWGKFVYTETMTGQIISRERALELALLPPSTRQGRYDMLNKKLCAICGGEGQDEKNKWGQLRYMEHRMSICPICIKDIYDKSVQPWRKN